MTFQSKENMKTRRHLIPTLRKAVGPSWALSAAITCALALSACGGGGDDGSSIAAAPTPASSTPVTPVNADPVAVSLMSFGVDSRLKLNALGGVYVEVFPIALFKDGRALADTTGLLHPAGLDAHRSQFPAAWTQWRQSGADLQVLQGNGTWKTLTSSTLPVAADDTRRVGIYESLSVASSPSISIIGSSTYTFTNAGAIGRGGYVVGDSANVSAISTTPNNRGTYSINGYRLNIAFENGAKEEHVIVVDTRPQYIFIDGVLYAKK